MEYRRDLEINLGNFDEAPRVVYVNAHLAADTVGAYAQDEYAVLDDLI